MRYRSIFLPCIGLLALVATGCAQTLAIMQISPAPPDEIATLQLLQPSDEKSIIYLLKEDQFYGSYRGAVVLIDDVPRALIATGGYTAIEIQSGNHRIEVAKVNAYCQVYSSSPTLTGPIGLGKPIKKFEMIVGPGQRAEFSFMGDKFSYVEIMASGGPVGIAGCTVFPDIFRTHDLSIYLTRYITSPSAAPASALQFNAFHNFSIYSDGFDLNTDGNESIYVFIKQNSWKMPNGGFDLLLLNENEATALLGDYTLTGKFDAIEEWKFIPSIPEGRMRQSLVKED